MNFVLDTNAIIRHFTGISRLGNNAKRVIFEGELNQHQLYISVISLMEIMYLAEKNRIPISLSKSLQTIRSKSCYSIVDLTPEILLEAEKIKSFELHDPLIIATAKYLNAELVSSDNEFSKLKSVKVIW